VRPITVLLVGMLGVREWTEWVDEIPSHVSSSGWMSLLQVIKRLLSRSSSVCLCLFFYSFLARQSSSFVTRGCLSVSTLRKRLSSSASDKDKEEQFKRMMENASKSQGIIPIGNVDDQDADGGLARFQENSSGRSQKFLDFRSDTSKRYFQIVDKLAPNEMLRKFTMSAPQNVQEAAKSTIMSILGNLPNYALDAALITTSSKLANLIYQMQMTGYMLKNAEYRMSLTRSLKGLPNVPGESKITEGNFTANPLDKDVTVSGMVEIQDTNTGQKTSVDVSELTLALSKEVEELRAELAMIRGEREQELSNNLLTYIQALPEREMASLSSEMSDDVVEAFSMLVNALMEKLQIDTQGPEVAVQQSMTAMAQLCMWQLVVGYRMRELEAFDRGAF
jgi:hypothetical protein